MALRVKVCGITNKSDAFLCCDAGADALGFIFYPESPRYVEPQAAGRIISSLPPGILPVGVFVNAPRSVIESVISTTGIRTIQFSGNETPSDCTGYAVPCWKAFRIRDESDLPLVDQYDIESVLLDGAPDGSYGGTGTLPDFTMARNLARRHRLIIAGGLNPENVIDAISKIQPDGIDVNSGVELVPGKKDPEKIKNFFSRLGRYSR